MHLNEFDIAVMIDDGSADVLLLAAAHGLPFGSNATRSTSGDLLDNRLSYRF